MAFSTEEIETKAETLLPGSIGDAERAALTAVCAAAQAALAARLREGVTQESLGETFTTACGLLAIAMYMELGDAAGDVSSFRAGNISVTRRRGGSSAARLRARAEELLSDWLEDRGFAFQGVDG